MATTTATKSRKTRPTTGPAAVAPSPDSSERPPADITGPDVQADSAGKPPQAPAETASAQAANPESLSAATISDGHHEDKPALPGRYEALRVSQILPNPKNQRDDAVALPGIVENLQTDGIAGLLAPLVVVPHGKDAKGNDRYLAVDGEQRYWSAIDADQEWVQAIIRPDLAGDIEQAVSMLRQMHRKDYTARQLARGFEQLSLYGLPDDEIARRTGHDPGRVKAARALGKLDTSVAERAEQYGLDLTRQATLAEFADDPDTVDKLMEEAEGGPFAFDRAVEEVRIDQAAQLATAQRREELTAAGITVLTERPNIYSNSQTRRVDSLRTGDGKRITDADHASCPGHAVAVYTEYGSRPVEITCCTDWKANGHTIDSISATIRRGPMTAEEKAERRTVIDNNKAMDAANAARRKWLTTLLRATTVPKDTDKLIAEVVAEPGYLLGVWVNGRRPMLDDLLAPGKKKRPGTKRVPARASKTQYTMITLAAVIAAHESAITRTSWRAPDPAVAKFLQWCMQNGFKPGKVEQLIIDAAAQPSRRRLTVVPNSDAVGNGPDTAEPDSAAFPEVAARSADDDAAETDAAEDEAADDLAA